MLIDRRALLGAALAGGLFIRAPPAATAESPRIESREDERRAGTALETVHRPRAGLLRLLRRALRARSSTPSAMPSAAASRHRSRDIYSMEGAAGLGGRLLFGALADRIGAKPVLVAGLLIQALAAVTYLKVNQLDGFYAVAIVFGMAYGGTMPLYASLARDAFRPAHPRHRARRGHAVQPGHGDRPLAGWLAVRPLWQLHVAVRRIDGRRPGGRGDRARLSAIAAGRAGQGCCLGHPGLTRRRRASRAHRASARFRPASGRNRVRCRPSDQGQQVRSGWRGDHLGDSTSPGDGAAARSPWR